jgi:hypothetical protein
MTTKGVIPAKAGIQKNTGFRVKPGMTNSIRLMSSWIDLFFLHVLSHIHPFRNLQPPEEPSLFSFNIIPVLYIYQASKEGDVEDVLTR